MCIIICKPEGVTVPSWEIFEGSFRANDDGAGYMFAHEGTVLIRKGFMTFEDFKENLSETMDKYGDLERKKVVFHFRYGTGGGVLPGLTHPFPISTNTKELTATSIQTHAAMAHNGVFSFAKDTNGVSDTMAFVRDYIGHLSWDEIKKLEHLLSRAFLTDRVVLLGGDNEDMMFGKWDTHEDDGCLYSNLSFKWKIGRKKRYNENVYDYDEYGGYRWTGYGRRRNTNMGRRTSERNSSCGGRSVEIFERCDVCGENKWVTICEYPEIKKDYSIYVCKECKKTGVKCYFCDALATTTMGELPICEACATQFEQVE